MKNHYAVMLISLLLAGCEKAHDYIKINPGAEMNLCTIRSISYMGIFSEMDSLVFTYNANGNPVSITRREVRSGFPNYAFRYDKKGRLTDFYGPYASPNSAEFWHKYFYDNKGRIVTDSIYTLCDFDEHGITNYFQASRRLLYYDIQNRIVLDSLDPPIIYYPSVNHYAYDAKGNRTDRAYDQKVHFRRTNKIWMFIDRDYSVNNPFVAETYNWYGLPTAFDVSTKGGEFKFLSNFINTGKIAYSCR